MLLKAPRSKARKTGELLDVSETFVLWDVLRSQYFALSRMLLWENYAHDPDLLVLISREKASLQRGISQLENLLNKFSIDGPMPNIKAINTSSNSEVITDEYIARDIFLLVQEGLGMVCTSFKNMSTNDALRKMMINYIKTVSAEVDVIIKYLKLKGWIDIPPLYPNMPADVSERLDVSEAFSLWDQLTYRYDNMRQTEVIMEYAYDQDFKMLLKRGHGILLNQITVLEKELLHFGIPLPQPHSKLIPVPESTEILRDVGMYRTIWLGMQASIVIHYESVKHSVVNDRIRQLFRKLLIEELELMGIILKYGKAKNWLNPAPKYSMNLKRD